MSEGEQRGRECQGCLANAAALWEEYNKVFKRQSIEQLINPEINLICFHNKALLADPASKRYLSAFLKDYTRPNHLPGSSHESH